MRQKTALRRLQRLDRNGWHEISVEAQSICQAASLAPCRRWRESWQTAFLAEDSPARRRLLTARHRHAPASRRNWRGHVGQETRDGASGVDSFPFGLSPDVAGRFLSLLRRATSTVPARWMPNGIVGLLWPKDGFSSQRMRQSDLASTRRNGGSRS
jgi:hypothetical protein